MEHKHGGCGDVGGIHDCATVFAKLQDFIDKELTAEDILEVEEHLKLCPPCAVEYRFEASVLRYMKGGFCQVSIPEDYGIKMPEGNFRGRSVTQVRISI